jgi:hypothetical protein
MSFAGGAYSPARFCSCHIAWTEPAPWHASQPTPASAILEA